MKYFSKCNLCAITNYLQVFQKLYELGCTNCSQQKNSRITSFKIIQKEKWHKTEK